MTHGKRIFLPAISTVPEPSSLIEIVASTGALVGVVQLACDGSIGRVAEGGE